MRVKPPIKLEKWEENHLLWCQTLLLQRKLFMTTNTSTLKLFRNTAVIEGISTVILFCIAMPLKYLADMPLAVTYVGWLHGILVMVYLYLLGACWFTYRWKFGRVVTFFLASLIPFAPFWVERRLRHEV